MLYAFKVGRLNLNIFKGELIVQLYIYGFPYNSKVAEYYVTHLNKTEITKQEKHLKIPLSELLGNIVNVFMF